MYYNLDEKQMAITSLSSCLMFPFADKSEDLYPTKPIAHDQIHASIQTPKLLHKETQH